MTVACPRSAAAADPSDEDDERADDNGAGSTWGDRGERSESESWFVDERGEHHDFVPTYAAWLEARDKPHYLRAAVEAASLVGLGTTLYWVQQNVNKEDWDDPGLGPKLGLQAWRLDSNVSSTNHLLHPGGGAFVYGLARINGLSIPAALGYSAAANVLWEILLEWREQVSPNDLVYSIGGGLPIGEFFFHLSDYLNSAPGGGGVGNKIAAYTLGLARAAHGGLDEPDPSPPTDRLGFSTAYGHAFRLAYEPVRVTNDRNDDGILHRAAIDAEIVAMPGFLRRGEIEKTFAQGNFSELHVRIASGPAGVDYDVRADATLFGHYSQRFESADSGHAVMVGLGSAWRFHESRLLGRRDQLPAVHIFGPHVAVWLSSGLVRATIAADAHVDFASLRSLTYDVVRPQLGEEGLKTVLVKQGYTYQLGGSARLRGSLSVGPLTLAGHVEYGRYGSIEGLDRKQELVTRDIHHTESVLEAGGTARVSVSVAEVGIGIAERRRESAMGSTSVDRTDRFVNLSVGLVF